MARMLSRGAYPRRCACVDCGDPARNRRGHLLAKRAARRRERRESLRVERMAY